MKLFPDCSLYFCLAVRLSVYSLLQMEYRPSGKIGVAGLSLGVDLEAQQRYLWNFAYDLGSIYVTAGAIILGVPIALLTSVFLAYYCPKRMYPVLQSAVSLMAGVPSVVYGFLAW